MAEEEDAVATTFADLGLRDELLDRPDAPRVRGADADPARGDPAADRGPRPARAGRHRHRQDRRVRAADPAAPGRPAPDHGARRARARAHARARDAGLRGHAQVRPRRSARACCPSTAASRSAAAARARARRRRRRRHARPRARPPQPRHAEPGRGARPSCSTRPTRCSTWASPRTSRRCSEAVPDARQTVLFSATMPPRLNGIAKRHLTRPGADRDRPRRRGGRRPSACARRRTSSRAPASRPRSAASSTSSSPTAALVFCRTRDEVDKLTETLNGRGYRAEALHGGMTQEQRDRVMGRLRSGNADLLVATDVAARGLDIDTLTHVVNYDVPSSPESYVHRIGRVGRAGREGVGDHARRAARAPLPEDDRADHQAADHDREDPDGRRPARAPAGAHARRPGGVAARGRRPRPLPRGRRDARRELRPDGRRRRRGQARPRGAAGSPTTRKRSPTPRRRRRTARRARPSPGKRPRREHDPDLRRRRPRRRHPPEGPRRRDHQRGRPARAATSAGSRSATASRSSRCPSEAAEHVISALRGTTIKGKKATIRRERFTQPRQVD